MDDFLTQSTTVAVITLALGGTLGWIQRRANAAEAAVDIEARELVLRYGPLLRVALPWAAAALAVAGAGVAIFTYPTDPGPALVYGPILVAMFGGGAIVTLLATRATVRYDGRRVVAGRPGGRETTIAWDEVKRVTYSKLWHGVVLHAPGKRRITAGLFMDGAADFIAAVRKQVEGKRRRDFEDEIAKRKER